MEELERQYTSVERVEERKLDRNGKVKQTESKTFDVAHLCGRNYERLIAVDDQPLSEREDTKERAKLDKCIEKLRHETPKARAKRLAKEAEELEDRRKMTREVLSAFDFEIAGEEFVRGVNAWRIAATPKQGYEPEFRKARFLTKLRGMIWIAQDNYGWVRTEAEMIDDASFGLFLLKLKKGVDARVRASLCERRGLADRSLQTPLQRQSGHAQEPSTRGRNLLERLQEVRGRVPHRSRPRRLSPDGLAGSPRPW